MISVGESKIIELLVYQNNLLEEALEILRPKQISNIEIHNPAKKKAPRIPRPGELNDFSK